MFWTTAPAGYTLYHPTIREFLSQSIATIPVITTPPTSYSSVDTN
jgi:hypothetical protein